MNHNVGLHRYNECKGKHFHEYHQILVPIQKNMSICVGGEEFDVTPQELCFIPRDTEHQCDFKGKLFVINLCSVENEEDKMLPHCSFVLPMKGQILKLVELIEAELSANPGSQAVQHLYSYLYCKLMENQVPPSIRYISEHYDLPVTVDQLAKMENYNVTYFNDWFKQQTGLSPGMYLRRTRIDNAKDLLDNTELEVTDIALMVGYSSNSTFTRAFHTVTGMSPKEHRENTKIRKKEMAFCAL